MGNRIPTEFWANCLGFRDNLDGDGFLVAQRGPEDQRGTELLLIVRDRSHPTLQSRQDRKMLKHLEA